MKIPFGFFAWPHIYSSSQKSYNSSVSVVARGWMTGEPEFDFCLGQRLFSSTQRPDRT
jgi:hypothetical protein